MFGKRGISSSSWIAYILLLLINGIFTAEIRHKTGAATEYAAAGSRILTRNHDNDGMGGSEESGGGGAVLLDNIQEESQHHGHHGHHRHGVRGYEDSEYEHVATYATHSSSLNPTAVIAISIFGVLAMLILLQLLGVRTFRSLSSSPLSAISLPFEWNFNSEMIPEIMTKVIDVVEKLDQKRTKGRPKRELGQAPSLLEWMSAYKKDPSEYECVRKLACETLAYSPLIAGSMKSKIGSTIMSTVKFFFDDGTMLVETIKDVLRDPSKCSTLFSEYVCDEPKSQTTSSSVLQKNRV